MLIRKNIFLTVVLGIIYLCTFGQVLDSKESLKGFNINNSTIKTSPFSVVAGPIVFTSEYRLAYETVLADNQSLQIGISYLGKSWYASLMENADSVQSQDKLLIKGVRVQLTYKIFLTEEKAPEGLYVAPHFSYSYCEFSTKYLNGHNYYIKAIYVNYNGLIGYQFIYDRLVLDAFCGLGYKDNTWLEHYRQSNSILDDEEFNSGHLKIYLGMNIGLSF